MLPQHARLRRREEFRRIYAAGKAYPDSCVVLHVLPLTDRPDECQVGFSVSKKVGVAVIRNRVKRRLRESATPLFPGNTRGAHGGTPARRGAADAEFADLAGSVLRVLTRAGLLAPDLASERHGGQADAGRDPEPEARD